MPGLNAIVEGITRRVNAHKTRHQKDGADEVFVIHGDVEGGLIGGVEEALDNTHSDLDGGEI